MVTDEQIQRLRESALKRATIPGSSSSSSSSSRTFGTTKKTPLLLTPRERLAPRKIEIPPTTAIPTTTATTTTAISTTAIPTTAIPTTTAIPKPQVRPTQQLIDQYRPQSLAGVIGNKQSIAALRDWVSKRSNPFTAASVPPICVIRGPHGSGKSISAYLALEAAGYTVKAIAVPDIKICKETKDQRSAINAVLRTATTRSLQGKSNKALIIDDFDGSRTGSIESGALVTRISPMIIECLTHLVTITKDTAKIQPIVIICNEMGLKSLQTFLEDGSTRVIRFYPPYQSDIERLLHEIATREGYVNRIGSGGIQTLASAANGDVRSAIMNLDFTAKGARAPTACISVATAANDVDNSVFQLLDRYIRASEIAAAGGDAKTAAGRKRERAKATDELFTLAQSDLPVMTAMYHQNCVAAGTHDLARLVDRCETLSGCEYWGARSLEDYGTEETPAGGALAMLGVIERASIADKSEFPQLFRLPASVRETQASQHQARQQLETIAMEDDPSNVSTLFGESAEDHKLRTWLHEKAAGVAVAPNYKFSAPLD